MTLREFNKKAKELLDALFFVFMIVILLTLFVALLLLIVAFVVEARVGWLST